MHEDRCLSMWQGVGECNGDYDVSMIQKTERMMLLLLDFRTNLPTPMDFLQFFLYLSDSAFDFTAIVSECLNFAYVCLIGKKFIGYYNDL